MTRRRLRTVTATAAAWLVVAPACAPGDAPGGVPFLPGAPRLDPLAQEFVDVHNAVRAGVDPPPSTPLPPVGWSDELAGVAQAWADGCVFEHSQGDLGENLALFSSSSTTATDVVDAWASEVADYDYDANRCAAGAQCGHYTQIVWRDSTTIGCAVTACDDVAGFGPGSLWVCNYDPPGNFIGQRPY